MDKVDKQTVALNKKKIEIEKKLNIKEVRDEN